MCLSKVWSDESRRGSGDQWSLLLVRCSSLCSPIVASKDTRRNYLVETMTEVNMLPCCGGRGYLWRRATLIAGWNRHSQPTYQYNTPLLEKQGGEKCSRNTIFAVVEGATNNLIYKGIPYRQPETPAIKTAYRGSKTKTRSHQ